MEKLGWLKNHFLDKYQCGPFVVEKDVDYYDDLRKRFKKLIKSAKDSGADTESIDILVKDFANYTNKNAIRYTYLKLCCNCRRYIFYVYKDKY